jgi:hypothetical protein
VDVHGFYPFLVAAMGRRGALIHQFGDAFFDGISRGEIKGFLWVVLRAVIREISPSFPRVPAMRFDL